MPVARDRMSGSPLIFNPTPVYRVRVIPPAPHVVG